MSSDSTEQSGDTGPDHTGVPGDSRPDHTGPDHTGVPGDSRPDHTGPDRTGTAPRVLRALAHPVRLDLLELLRHEGPLTATECGAWLDLTPKVCSYHLTTLAKYGFVEETGEGKGRARPWRLASTRVGYVHHGEHASGPDLAGNEFARVLLRRDEGIIERFIAERHRLEASWRNISTMSSSSPRLTAEQLAALTRDLVAVLEHYDTATDAPSEDARPVRIALYAVPDLTTSGSAHRLAADDR